MADTICSSPLVSPQRIEAFISRAFEAVSVPRDDAKIIASVLVRADLGSAVYSQGVARLPQYIRRIKGGAVNPKPNIRIEREAPGMALINGDNGMGQLVMHFAAQKAIEKAKTAGVAWIGVRWSNHAGPASLYVSMLMAHDMVGLCFAVGSSNHMPPLGGIDMLFGANPIAIGVPAGKEPAVLLDMSATVAGYGKVRNKAQRGEMMPEGWMVDREGKPLTDPRRAHEGFLVPIGGYKGYGLVLMSGLLAGTLNGAAMGRDVVDFLTDDTTPTNTGQVIVAISLSAFGDVADFKHRVDALVRDIRGSRRLPGVDAIRLPGEQRHARLSKRTRLGIPMPEPLLKSLNQLAIDLGITGL